MGITWDEDNVNDNKVQVGVRYGGVGLVITETNDDHWTNEEKLPLNRKERIESEFDWIQIIVPRRLGAGDEQKRHKETITTVCERAE